MRTAALAAIISFFASTATAADWNQAKSEHCVVFFKKAPQRFVEAVLAKVEENYRKTTETLGFTRYKGWIWKDRVKIYIYDDAQDFRKSSGLGWAAGSVVTKLRLISTYPSAHGFFDSVLPHEMGHIIFRDFIGADTIVPLWLEEGAAMYQEESGRFGADSEVRDLLAAGKFIGIDELSRMAVNGRTDNNRVDIFYAEAASLVGFLIREGEVYRFTRLCRELKEGARFEWALKKSYVKYQTVASLEAAWKEYLRHEKKER